MFATSSALNARFNATQTHARAHRRRSSSRVEAFWKKAPPPPPPPPPPPKKPAFFAFRKPQPPAREEPVYEYEETKGEAYARIRKQRAKRKAEFEARERGGFASALWKVTSALDFQEDIVADRGLLASAKNMRKGEKMDRAQYGALKRKVGGSKSGFFGESVDVKGKYTDSGYVDQEEDVGVPSFTAAPFLFVVVLAVLATTAWVASQVP